MPQDIVPCIVTSKKKELIVKKILQYWITIFGHPIKILVDNRGTGGGIQHFKKLMLGYVPLLQRVPGVMVIRKACYPWPKNYQDYRRH